MRILSHYFVTRFLGLFAMVLATAFLVLATIELVLNLEDVSAFSGAEGGAQSPGSAETTDSASAGPASNGVTRTLRYLGLRLTAYYLADLLPVASFIAVFLVFAIAGRAMEVLAAEAGGIPPVRLVLPVLFAALILSFATAILHETVILRAEEIWSGESDRVREPVEFRNEAFWLHRGPLIANVAGSDPETRTLFDVEIFERSRNGAVTRVIRAPSAHVSESGSWQIPEARVWRFDASDPESSPDLGRSETIELDLAALDTAILRGADPNFLPLPALAHYLAGEPAQNPSALRRIQARYYERLASPWLVFVFAWLAIPFAIRVDQRGRIAGPALAAVTGLALYFVAQSAGQSLAQQELIPVGIAPWSTMGVACALATIGFVRRAR